LALLLTATAVVATVLGAVLGARLLGGDGGGDGGGGAGGGGDTASDGETGTTAPETSSGGSAPEDTSDDAGADLSNDEPVIDGRYEVAQSEVAVPIRAPLFHEDTDVSYSGECLRANLTLVDLAELSARTGIAYGSFEHTESDFGFRYMFCDDADASEDGIWFDPAMFVGATDDRGIDAEGCYEAAHSNPLPNPVPPDDITQGVNLRENTGICAEGPDGTVVLLWIDAVEPDPNNRDLPSYLTTATQWRPADQ
ncbi:hypothetical protein, partial [Streptomyces mayteni]